MRRLGALAALATWAGGSAPAQVMELQAHALVTAATHRFAGAGLGVALRGAQRLRLALGASVGELDSVLAGRAEALATFHLYPGRRQGIAPYAGGGISLTRDRSSSSEYLVLLFGIESRPAGRTGWFVEVGVGGGFRAAAGVRVRTRR